MSLTIKEIEKIVNEYINFTNIAHKSQEQVVKELSKKIYKEIKKRRINTC